MEPEEFINENRDIDKYCEWFEALQLEGLRIVNMLEEKLEHLLDEDLCFEAVKQDCCAFKYVPDNLKTYPMCLTAVEKGSFNLQYVPEHFKTFELCSKAVKEDKYALRFIPKKALTVPETIFEAKTDCFKTEGVHGFTLHFASLTVSPLTQEEITQLSNL
jgi:hypothetical protein